MHIVFLNPSGQCGGAEISLAELIAAVRQHKPLWKLTVVLGESGPLVPRLEALGADVVVEEMPERLARAGERVELLRVPAAMAGALSYVRRLSQTLLALQPDIIHTNGLKMHAMGVWARPRNAQIVWHLHDYVQSRPAMRRLLRWHAGRVSTVVTNSESVRTDVSAVVPGGTPVHTIYNAVDFDRFNPEGEVADIDRLAGFPHAASGVLRVGLIATFARWKGHNTFLKAISLLPEQLPVRAYVVGGPIYQTAGSQHDRDELVREALRLGVAGRVGFTGFVYDTAPVMRALDVVVHASTSPEPFGMVVAEAMACQRAVIASEAGGAKEIFEHGITGIGHRPGDAEELAGAIMRLANDRNLRMKIAAAARDSVLPRFGRQRLAVSMAALYESVLRRQEFEAPVVCRGV